MDKRIKVDSHYIETMDWKGTLEMPYGLYVRKAKAGEDYSSPSTLKVSDSIASNSS